MDRLRRDGDGEAACAAVCAALGDLDDDPEDGPVLWFALADTMWQVGRLTDEVQRKALFHLDDGADLTRWQQENPVQAPKRAAVLDELRARLLSPQPPKKPY